MPPPGVPPQPPPLGRLIGLPGPGLERAEFRPRDMEGLPDEVTRARDGGALELGLIREPAMLLRVTIVLAAHRETRSSTIIVDATAATRPRILVEDGFGGRMVRIRLA